MKERGETLTEAMLSRCRPVRGEGGRTLRAYCPFHGSDQQRSLRVDLASGRFQCFACQTWGYLESARAAFSAARSRSQPVARKALPAPVPIPAPVADCQPWLEQYQSALPGSPGQEYLLRRGIPLEFAQRFGLGYSAPGKWAHRDGSGRPLRDAPQGRLVFPHTTPGMTPAGAGEVINLYGRSVGEAGLRYLRHDHLPGRKGYFHARALAHNGPVYVCEGPFDALSLMLCRPGLQALAIFGVNGWRMDWSQPVKHIVFALDADAAGQNGWRGLARQLVLQGKRVEYLPAEAYGGAKDANEAWVRGSLSIG